MSATQEKPGVSISIKEKEARGIVTSGRPFISEGSMEMLRASGIDPEKNQQAVREAVLRGKPVVADVELEEPQP